MNIPQPEMYGQWMDWARALVASMLATSEAPAKALDLLGDFADDAAAAAAKVPVGGLYRTGSNVKVRIG